MEFINKSLAIGASLVAGSVMALSASSAQAAIINFSNGSVTVSGLTTFTFVPPSRGEFESDLFLTLGGPLLLSEADPGFRVPIVGDFEGDCDVCTSTFDFGTGNASYDLLLTNTLNGAPVPSVVSSTNATFAPSDSGILVSFDDNGAGPDRDFNDFRFTITPARTVPEPTALAGLGLVAGALAFSRRRKSNKAV
ncbi:MAG TPA: PEP-CTERM sorting domain-containing protein [Leptolyngbyaceae cyanobacterium]